MESGEFLQPKPDSSLGKGASLRAQLVKNPPAMQETWVQPWVGKICWRRERLPTPVLWPGESHRLYSPRGHKESDMTEVTWHACNPCMAGFTSEWASLIAQLVKNPPAMWETWV